VNKENVDINRLLLIILILLSIEAALFSDLYVSSLPMITKSFNINVRLGQTTISIFMLGFALGQYVYGTLSDNFGRRRVVIVALLIAITASFICIIAANIETLLIGRFIQGLGVAACLCMPRAIMRDVSNPKQMAKSLSIISAYTETIITMAPALGAFISSIFGWVGNFYFLLFYSLLLLIIVYYYLPETKSHQNYNTTSTNNLKKNYWRLLTNQQFICYAICSGVGYALLMVYFMISPFIIQKTLYFTIHQYGLITIFISCMLVIGAVLNNYCLKRFNLKTMIMSGVILVVLASIGMFISTMFIKNIYTITIPSMVAILGAAFLFANCSAGALANFADIAGNATSIYSGVQITFAFILVEIISLFNPKTFYTLNLSYFIMSLILVICFSLLKFLPTRR